MRGPVRRIALFCATHEAPGRLPETAPGKKVVRAETGRRIADRMFRLSARFPRLRASGAPALTRLSFALLLAGAFVLLSAAGLPAQDAQTGEAAEGDADADAAAASGDAPVDQPLEPLRMAAEPLSPQTAGDGGRADRADGVETFSLPAGKALFVRFPTTDDLSGVQDVYVQLNDAAFTRNVNRELRLTEDGLYNIRWYSRDRAGNSSEVQARAIRIDSTAPKIHHFLTDSPLVQGETVGPKALLALSAEDGEGVGVKAVEWRASRDGRWNPYTGPVRLADVASSQDGTETGVIQYRAVDRLDNDTGERVFHYRIDRRAPAIPPLFRTDDRPHRVGQEGVAVGRIEEGAVMEYKIGDSNYTRVEEGEHIRFDEEGRHTLTVRISDAVGNLREESYDVLVDFSAPVSEIKTSAGSAQ